MRACRRCLLLIGILLWAHPVFAQESTWERHMAAGTAAFQERRYADAEKHFEAAVTEAKRFGPDSERLVASLDELAIVCQLASTHCKAEPILKLALAIREKAHGPEDPSLLKTLDSLAQLHLMQREFKKAKPYYVRALAIREKTLGPDDLAIAVYLEELAVPMFSGNVVSGVSDGTQRKSARSTSEPINPEQKLVFDPSTGQQQMSTQLPVVTPPDTPNPGSSYVADDSKEGIQLLQRALAIRTKALGLEHPTVLAGIDRLANLLSSKGRNSEASQLYAQALSIREKQLGTDWNALLNNLFGLALSLAAEKQYAEAELVLHRGHSLIVQQLGSEHSVTAIVTAYLAEIYRDQQKYTEAEPLFVHAIATLENDPKRRLITAWAMRQYAILMRSTKRQSEANAMQARAEKLILDLVAPSK